MTDQDHSQELVEMNVYKVNIYLEEDMQTCGAYDHIL